MDIEIFRQGATAIFTPEGRIEGSNADQFHQSITSAVLPSDQAICIDLNQVSYVSSAGLRSFAIIAKVAGQNQMGFALANASRSVMNVIQVTGFTQLMNVKPDLETALVSLEDPASHQTPLVWQANS